MNDKASKKSLILFGQGLRKIRTDKGLSQEELASLADIDRSYLGAIERGEHNPALLNIMKIAAALEVPPQELFGVYNSLSLKGK